MEQESTTSKEAVTLPERQELTALIEHWEQLARVAFKTAKKEEDPFGRRFIEYGAMIHFNCSQELRRLLDIQT